MTAIFLSIIATTLWLSFAPDLTAADIPTIPASAMADSPARDPMVMALIDSRRAAVAADPAKAKAWGALGLTFHAHGLTDEALRCYQQAATLDPADGHWPYYQGLVHASLHHWDKAVELMKQATTLRPDYGPAFWRQARYEVARNNTEQAEQLFMHASRLDLDSPVPLLGIAQIFVSRGQHAEAVAWLENVVAQHPDELYARHLLAESYDRTDRKHDAEITRQGSIAVEPDWHDDWEYSIVETATGYDVVMASARRQFDAKRFRPTIQKLDSLRQHWPHDPEANRLLAAAHLEVGQYREALQAIAAGMTEAPLPPQQQCALRLLKGRALARLNDWSNAEIEFNLITSSQPDDGDAWVHLANARLQLGRREEAAAALRTARQHPIASETALADRVRAALDATPAAPAAP
jgi:tetratricopeptide (TPR) repeat protein